MDIKLNLNKLKDRIATNTASFDCLDIINEIAKDVDKLIENQVEAVLDESPEAMLPSRGINIIEPTINIYFGSEFEKIDSPQAEN